MRRFLQMLIVVPAAFLLIVFAIANHHDVKVSLDPFARIDDATLSVHAPLFVVLIVAAMLGVVVGGIATWFSQGKHRRSEREARGEVDRLRRERSAASAGEPPRDNRPSLPAGG
jgi:uncharacterized integral membrane protein